MTGHQSAAWAQRIGVAVALLAVMALAVGVRSLGLEYVFVGDEIVFPPADPQYHLRRALYTWARFPDVLLFDRYINHPGGAPVPWPPLFDWTLGALGRLAGGELRDLERVAVWSGPFCAAVAIVPLYLAGARLGSRRVGVIAGLVFALVPISVVYTRVGNADHHAAVGMIGAWLLCVLLAMCDPEATPRRMVGLAVALFVVRVAMLLTWHGSLLYLAPAEGLLLLVAVASGRAAVLAAQALGAGATALVVMIVLSASPTPLGGPYSSIALSRLHVLAMLWVAFTAGGLLGAMRPGGEGGRQRAGSPGARALWAAGAALAFAMLVLAFPATREGLVPGIRFITMGDEVGAITGEQTPLFAFGDRLRGPPATHSWGWLAWALPLAPLAGWLPGRSRASRSRAAGLVLGGWGLVFCGLAVLQRRYGNDAAPAASLLFALALVAGADRLLGGVRPGPGRRIVAAGIAVAAVGLLFLPAATAVYGPRARGSIAAWRAPDAARRATSRSVAHTLHHFTRLVRAVTPETDGYLTPSGVPAYGVIAHANLGHALQYGARRATATDPFWWFIGRENWDLSLAFLAARDEGKALELARALDGRYVVTMPGLGAGTLVSRLHARDGTAEAPGRPGLGHFRLVTEAPRGGQSIGALFARPVPNTIPYKLFEIVAGAELVVAAQPGETVTALVALRAPTGRAIRWSTSARARADGVARLRVPYPTRIAASPGEGPVVRALGPYRVTVGATERRVEVDAGAVREGRAVPVGPASPAPPTRSGTGR
jgi:asparagine N-glycosylation enzyme membrane subunit Stt3